jgi:hypothetical protein
MREYLATLLGAGLLTFPFLGQPKILQTPPPPVLQKAPVIELKKSESKVSKRHRVQVQVISLSDLKISEGSQVAVGQIISDRTDERESLEAQRNQIDISIKQLSVPMSKIAEVPAPNFAIQEAAIARIKGEMELIENQQNLPAAAEPYFRFKDERLKLLFEGDKLNKVADSVKAEAENKARIAEAKARLAMELNQAIAALDKAKSDQQQQQYEHSLNLIRQQGEMQRQQYQVASLVAGKQEIEAKLREITQIKSPVAGRVRRIKNLGQKDRAINLEVTIDVK